MIRLQAELAPATGEVALVDLFSGQYIPKAAIVRDFRFVEKDLPLPALPAVVYMQLQEGTGDTAKPCSSILRVGENPISSSTQDHPALPTPWLRLPMESRDTGFFGRGVWGAWRTPTPETLHLRMHLDPVTTWPVLSVLLSLEVPR